MVTRSRWLDAPERRSLGWAPKASERASTVDPDGLVGQLGPIALANEKSPGAVALRITSWWRDPLREQGKCGLHLVSGPPRCNDLDQVGRHAAAAQLALDPLGAPALDRALVLREALRETGVVQEARLLQLAYRVLDRRRLDPLALEESAQLGDSAVAGRNRPAGELDGPLLLGSRGRRSCLRDAPVQKRVLAQAAFSRASTGAAPTSSTGTSTAATGGPWSIPTTS